MHKEMLKDWKGSEAVRNRALSPAPAARGCPRRPRRGTGLPRSGPFPAWAYSGPRLPSPLHTRRLYLHFDFSFKGISQLDHPDHNFESQPPRRPPGSASCRSLSTPSFGKAIRDEFDAGSATHDIQDISKRRQLEFRFGGDSDFGFRKPCRFFDLPSARSESPATGFGMGSVSVIDGKGLRKNVWDS